MDSEAQAMELLRGRYRHRAGVLTACGAAALEAALVLLRVGPGDEVVLPATGCYKIAAAVLRVGAVPVFTAVGRRLVLSAAAVLAALSPRTRCVIAVHQYGLPCPVGEIREVVPEHVSIVEDAAQAWGSRRNGRFVGGDGDAVVVSFGSSKPVALGAGGALLSDRPGLETLVTSDTSGQRRLARPALPAPFPVPLAGELVAALKRADDRIARRRAFARRVLPALAPAGYASQERGDIDDSSWHRLPVWSRSIADRDALIQHARRHGIRAQQDHDVPLHRLAMFDGRSRYVSGSEEHGASLALLGTDGSQEQASALRRALKDAARCPGRKGANDRGAEPQRLQHVHGAPGHSAGRPTGTTRG